MGLILTHFWRLFTTEKSMRILMLGLDGAGKTTILYKLKLGELITTIPTIVLTNEFQALIYVVDSSDVERIAESKEELDAILNDPDMTVLVFANKNDMPNAMTTAQLTEKLGLQSMRGRDWFVQSSNAKSGDGIFEGLAWLEQKLRDVNHTRCFCSDCAREGGGTRRHGTECEQLLLLWEGFNREEVEYKNVKFTIWDIHTPAPELGGFCTTVNGEIRIREMWKPYFDATQALIFVVDSSNMAFMKRAREELHAILSDPIVTGRKLLVLANEKNAETALSSTELTERLYLNVFRGREWHILKCNAKSGEGLYEGLEWFMRK
ncbi:hypothetical protein PRIPAC_79331 [Pristionchus pacificus]|uniref:ADP ribosylation factor n=1 Tax=Pristionchus pacificus TaxID=54126 RepID=A0A2A6C4G9_PRIPA|nr:hypothetical protein PRIPAC_79331 [Pristionchus pacificus]|eukprot:PDM72943.1 ADP ribosylation factor [Pristionchus pacificus]